MSVASLSTGSRVAYGGGVWTVVALTGQRATLSKPGTGETRSVAITHLLIAPGSRLLDVAQTRLTRAVAPLWPTSRSPNCGWCASAPLTSGRC